jgi:hypothetical protein
VAQRSRHTQFGALPRAQELAINGVIHRVGAGSVKEVLVRLARRPIALNLSPRPWRQFIRIACNEAPSSH